MTAVTSGSHIATGVAASINRQLDSAGVDLADAWAFSTGSRRERTLVSDARSSLAAVLHPLDDAALDQVEGFAALRAGVATADDHLASYEEALRNVRLVGSIEDGDQLASRATDLDRSHLRMANGALGSARDALDDLGRLPVAEQAAGGIASADDAIRATGLRRVTDQLGLTRS